MYLVVSDIVNVEDPIFLWRFVRSQGEQEHFIELANESVGNSRFDLFTLVLPTDLDLQSGMYRYYVYQSTTTGDHDYADMLELACGRVDVTEPFATNETYEPNLGSDEVYQAQT